MSEAPSSRWTRLQPWVPVLAMLLCLPALAGGLELDDVLLASRADDAGELLASAFTFFGDGPRPPHVPATDLPWWTEAGNRLDLFRPIAALTHLLDFRAWPGQPWLMHLHSVLWYGLLVWLVQRLYLALTGDASRAALAAAIFGLSQAHAMDVGWLSARNAVIAGVLVTATLLLHHRARTSGSRAHGVAAPLVFLLALLSNEGSVAALGYLVAYAVALDRGRRRWLSLLPYLVVAIAWRSTFQALDYGAAHSGIYLDPGSDPLGYAVRTIVQGASVLAARLGLAVLDPLGSLPGAYLAAFVASLPFLGGLAWLLRERLRTDAVTRLWALGLVLSCFTAGTSVPTDRGLLLLGLGGGAVLADLILTLRRDGSSRGRRFFGASLIGLHLVLSPLLMPLRVQSSAWVHGIAERITASLPRGPEVADRTVVLLQAPSDLAMLYARAIVERGGETFPARLRWLYAGPAPLTLTRTDAQSFELRPEAPWLVAPLDRMFRGDLRFTVGQRFDDGCIESQVVALDERSGLPSTVRFTLHAERRGCRFELLAWQTDRFAPFELPAVGASSRLEPALPF